jgi:CheY-like chemotaxis protein
MTDPTPREQPAEDEQNRGAEDETSGQRDVKAASTVLVAENEENNRLLMEHILMTAGYQCVSASNGAEVLALLETRTVDVVLLDLSMPVLDGVRTIQMIRRRPELAALPVVAVTGHASSEDRDQALAAGCTDYLAKPYRPQELVAAVERMLAHGDEGD